MKFTLVLSVLALAALGASDPQSASVDWALSGPSGDVVMSNVNVPRDTVDTLTTFEMSVGIENHGTKADSGRLSIIVSDTAVFRVVYAESCYFRILPGTVSRVEFPQTRFTTLGPHHGLVRFWTYRGCKDSLRWDFWVVVGLGMEESHQPQAPSHKPEPTIVRGTLMLGAEGGSQNTGHGAQLLDVTGRKVLDLHAGPNDTSGLTPGVYFVQEQPAFSGQHPGTVDGARSTVHVRKVVIQR
jgi:hypothetical protein